MNKVIILITFSAFFFFSPNSYSAENLIQHTEGNQSPAVNVAPGGKATINYGKTKASNLSPNIKSKLEYPLKLVNDKVRKQLDNPEITLVNTGPITATAFSMDLKVYYYDKNRAEIVSVSEMQQVPQDHFISVKELAHSENIKRQLPGVHGKKMVGIYIFTLKYYRETDMKMFNRQDIFFIENYKIFSKNDYLKNNNYPKIMQAIKSYKPASNETAACLQAIDNHVWVLNTGKKGIYTVSDDRKLLSVSSVDEDLNTRLKKEYLNATRPLLSVRPIQSKKTGTYFDPEFIDDDTVKVVIKYEVENIGNMDATSVSEEGSTPYSKSLRPGEKIYLTNEVTLHRPPKVPVKNMDKQDFVIEHGNTVLYSQVLGDKEYKARFVYRIKKSNIELIKYETE